MRNSYLYRARECVEKLYVYVRAYIPSKTSFSRHTRRLIAVTPVPFAAYVSWPMIRAPLVVPVYCREIDAIYLTLSRKH